jgi:hypothetical protein
MNRRGFLASLPFLPAAVKAAVQLEPELLWKFVLETNTKEYTLRSTTWTVRLPAPTHPLFISQLTEKEWRQRCLARQLAMPTPRLP